MGVELELQVLDRTDYNLVAGAPDLLRWLQRKPFPGTVTPEITQSMIEIATSVHANYTELVQQLREIRDTLLAAADYLNLGLSGGGTHPFQSWPDQKITDKERYLEVSSLYGYLAKQFTVFGQHVHIGCGSGSDAMYLLHALSRFVPQFIALSASSPFVLGHDTQFDSARLNSVFAFPLSGRAPFVLDWEDFERGYFAKMEKTGVVKSMKDFYWDIRPKPEYGTIELRVCDCPLSVDRAAALAGYLQTLCHHLMQSRDTALSEDDYLVYNYNRFQACRFGLDGVIIEPWRDDQMTLREHIRQTMGLLSESARTLGTKSALDHLLQVADSNNDAQVLRLQKQAHGHMASVVECAIERFRQ